jgi:hypothetical protein
MTEKAARRNFVEQFLEKHFAKQPPWLRSLIYFMMFMLFAYSFLRLVGGDFAVRGQVFKGASLVQNNFDVCIGDGRYGTNSIGQFYAVLPPADYYAMLYSGKVHVDIFQGSQRIHQQDVAFVRLGKRLADINLADPAMASVPSRWDWSLIPAAYAQTKVVVSPDRLFIERLFISDTDARDADVTLTSGSTKSALLLDGRAGSRIPVLGGREIDLGNRFYFPISSSLAGKKVTITVDTKTGYFSNRTDTFIVVVPAMNQAAIAATVVSRIVVRHRAAATAR